MSGSFLGGVPGVLHLLQRRFLKALPLKAGIQEFFHALESIIEFFVRSAERVLGVYAQMARKIYRSEQDIPEFLGDAIRIKIASCFIKLGELLFELLQHARCV